MMSVSNFTYEQNMSRQSVLLSGDGTGPIFPIVATLLVVYTELSMHCAVGAPNQIFFVFAAGYSYACPS